MNDAKPSNPLRIFDEVKKEAAGLFEKTAAIAKCIHDDYTFREAGEFRRLINERKKARLAKLDPIVSSARSTWDMTVKLRREAIAPLDCALALLDPPLAEWHTKLENDRRREEEKLIAKSVKQQEEDLAQIAKLAKNDPQRASSIMDRPVVPVVSYMPPVKKIEGVVFRENWKVDHLVDMKLLVKAVADGIAPLTLLQPNLVALNQMARALKGNMVVPGVRVVMEKIVASKGETQ